MSLSLTWSQANTRAAMAENEYSDWRLPSINEMQLMYDNKTTITNAGGTSIYCGAAWSSDEVGTDQAKVFEFNYNYEEQKIQTKTKDSSACVVAVRSF